MITVSSLGREMCSALSTRDAQNPATAYGLHADPGTKLEAGRRQRDADTVDNSHANGDRARR